MKQIVKVGLALILIIIIFVIIIGFISVITYEITPVFTVLLIILTIFALIALIPFMQLVIFPALFKGETVRKSIIKCFYLGFKYWGSTIVILMIIGIASTVISMFLQLPFSIKMIISPEQTGIVSYMLISLYSLSSAIIIPVMFIFLAFQYFSITEKEEGISLKTKIEAFDKL